MLPSRVWPENIKDGSRGIYPLEFTAIACEDQQVTTIWWGLAMDENTVDLRDQDVVDVLTADHREVSMLIEDILAVGDVDRQRELADIVTAELVRHAVAEEMFVYPVMKAEFADGDEVVEHDTEEHDEIEQALKRLEGIPATEQEFIPAVKNLKELIDHHVEDEESEQFPRLRAELSRDKLLAMAQQVQAAKKIAPTRPHPDAPNSELFHLTLGPGVGFVDKLRDAVSGRVTHP